MNLCGLSEENLQKINRELEEKWRKNRHLYYSAEKLADVLRQEEQDARKSSF